MMLLKMVLILPVLVLIVVRLLTKN